MTIYQDELEQLKAFGNRIARFRRVAIHCHTPLSHDWAQDGGDPALNEKKKYLDGNGEHEFLNAVCSAFTQDLDVLVPTDHMKCAYAARLVEAGTGRGLVVLPGMEVTLRTTAAMGNVRIHVLVLLPVGSTRESFAPLLLGLPEENRRNGQETLQEEDLRGWVKRVHDADGLCIAAHVESDQGIRKCFRQTAKNVLCLVSRDAVEQEEEQARVEDSLKDLIFNIGFDAIEIKQPKDACHYRWVDTGGTPRRIPTVLGLDAHSIEEYQRPEKLTLIKMTSPESRGLACLKEAFTFADTRIRFPSDLPEPPSPRVLGVVIKGTDGTTFFPDLVVPLSENLNCIIGPRGAGKSTFVEALRYVFGYNRTLEDELGKELAKRIRSLQEATLKGATIRVYYQMTDEKVSVLQATYDSTLDYTTRVFQLDGTDTQIEDVEHCGKFPLRLYGWSEIEKLGQEGRKQRIALDRMIHGVDALVSTRADLCGQLSHKCTEIQTCVSELTLIMAEQNGALRRWAEHKNEFKKYDTPDAKVLFRSLDMADSKGQIILRVNKNVADLKASLDHLLPVKLSDGIAHKLEADEPLQEWWLNGTVGDVDLTAAETEVTKGIQQAIDALASLGEKLGGLDVQTKDELARLDADLREQVSSDSEQESIAARRQNAKNRFDAASTIRDRYLRKWREFLRHLVKHRRIARQLQETQRNLSEVRSSALATIESQLNDFLTEKLRITVSMVEGGDRRDFREKLSEFIRLIGMKNDRKWREVLSAFYTPCEFSEALLRTWISNIAGQATTTEDGNTFSLKTVDIGTLKEQAVWAEKDEGAGVFVFPDDGKTLLSILALCEIPWDDEVSISLNGKPIASCSPGQRSSAMLPLIMLAEKCPLVIDQPEDNLDNRLVGGVLSEILAERKEQRQIITCTHSPNIVVLGDSEQVVPLEPESDKKGKIGPSACGSIDNDDIIRTIIETMEGGDEAFKARRTRYNL